MNINKNLTIEETFNLAVKNHQEGKTDIAQELYDKILEIDPNYTNALSNLSVIFFGLGDYKKAIIFLEKAIKINPNYADAHNNLGVLAVKVGNIHKAKKCHEKAIEINPNYADAHCNLGVIFQKLEEHQKAKSCYEKAIEIDPNHVDTHYNLGLLFKDLGETQKAIHCYEKVIGINPNHINAHNNLGVIFQKLEEHQKAIHLKSKDIVSNAKLENVIPRFIKKLQNQNGIPTFFDNAVNFHLTKKMNPDYDFCEIFEKVQNSKENRFVSHSTRIKDASKSEPNNKSHQEPLFLSSQGTHSLIKWKEKPLYKTAFDLVIYSMILQEVKPDVIIELGSGLGGSAIWLADTASMLGLDTHVYSFDINKPMFKHNKVTFIEQDLTKINLKNKPQYWELFNGKKVIIEDAHVNLKDILNLFDSIIRKDDYLIIEDSNKKQNIISNFSNEKEPKYKLDQFFLDFFGTNITCCTNSIFKCY